MSEFQDGFMDIDSREGMVFGFHSQGDSGFAGWAFVHGFSFLDTSENTTFPIQYTTQICNYLLIRGILVNGIMVCPGEK